MERDKRGRFASATASVDYAAEVGVLRNQVRTYQHELEQYKKLLVEANGKVAHLENIIEGGDRLGAYFILGARHETAIYKGLYEGAAGVYEQKYQKQRQFFKDKLKRVWLKVKGLQEQLANSRLELEHWKNGSRHSLVKEQELQRKLNEVEQKLRDALDAKKQPLEGEPDSLTPTLIRYDELSLRQLAQKTNNRDFRAICGAYLFLLKHYDLHKSIVEDTPGAVRALHKANNYLEANFNTIENAVQGLIDDAAFWQGSHDDVTKIYQAKEEMNEARLVALRENQDEDQITIAFWTHLSIAAMLILAMVMAVIH